MIQTTLSGVVREGMQHAPFLGKETMPLRNLRLKLEL